MAATVRNSLVLFKIFIVLNAIFLAGSYSYLLATCNCFIENQSCRNVRVNGRKLQCLPVLTHPICFWQKHGEICLFLPFSDQDNTIAVDIEIQPGPCSQFPNCLRESELIHVANGLISNLNFPNNYTNYNYSRQQLFELLSQTPVQRNMFLSLNNLGILRLLALKISRAMLSDGLVQGSTIVDRSKVRDQTKIDTQALQVGGWA